VAEREEWNKLDPGLEALAKKSEGYAFFPEITKGGPVAGAMTEAAIAGQRVTYVAK
jgi:hypothetical protein